jgi:hypothetical protein
MQSSLGLQADLSQLGPGFALRRRTRGYQRFADPVGLVDDAQAVRSPSATKMRREKGVIWYSATKTDRN